MSKSILRSTLFMSMSTVAVLANLAIANPAAAAGIEQGRSQAVRYADLDLRSGNGVARLESRVARAAHAVCDIGGRGAASAAAEAGCRKFALATAQPQLEMAIAAARDGRDYAAADGKSGIILAAR